LIHASDHPEAPKLMNRAYLKFESGRRHRWHTYRQSRVSILTSAQMSSAAIISVKH
jgi:hypothetical protein